MENNNNHLFTEQELNLGDLSPSDAFNLFVRDPVNAYNKIYGGKRMEVDNNAVEEPLNASKSTIKLIKNSRGMNWEIKVVMGDSDELLDNLKDKAIALHQELETEFS